MLSIPKTPGSSPNLCTMQKNRSVSIHHRYMFPLFAITYDMTMPNKNHPQSFSKTSFIWHENTTMATLFLLYLEYSISLCGTVEQLPHLSTFRSSTDSLSHVRKNKHLTILYCKITMLIEPEISVEEQDWVYFISLFHQFSVTLPSPSWLFSVPVKSLVHSPWWLRLVETGCALFSSTQSL